MIKIIYVALIAAICTLFCGCSDNKDKLAGEPQTINELIEKLEMINEGEREEYFLNNFYTLKQESDFPVINGNQVTFVYIGDAKKVDVIGDVVVSWNNQGAVPMKKINGTKMFYLKKRYYYDSRLEYKLVVDGRQQNDPLNKRIFPNSYSNNELIMPGYKYKEELDYISEIEHGKLLNKSIKCNAYNTYGKIIQSERPYYVYLPPGYNQNQKYKVIYLHDGISYANEGKIPNILDYMISKREIEPVIAVFIGYVNREADYESEYRGEYAEYIHKEFIPMIEKEYSVRNDAEGRCIVGLSSSGSFVGVVMNMYPDFYKYALLDSPVVFNIKEEAKELKTKELKMKICMVSGNFEPWYSEQKILYNYLKQNPSIVGIKYFRTKQTHNFRLWSDTFRESLIWMFNGSNKTDIIKNNGNAKLRFEIAWKNDEKYKEMEIDGRKKVYIAVAKSAKEDVFNLIGYLNNLRNHIALKEIDFEKTTEAEVDIKVDKLWRYGAFVFEDSDGSQNYSSGDKYLGEVTLQGSFTMDEEDVEDTYNILVRYFKP